MNKITQNDFLVFFFKLLYVLYYIIADIHKRHLLVAEPEILENCTPAAILDFPWDHLTREERQSVKNMTVSIIFF